MELSRTAASFLLFFGIFLCLIIPKGMCIRCYQCNSAYDPRCADTFDPYSIGQVDCDRKPKLDHLNSYNATLCRKIKQKVNGEFRTIRTCGFIMSEQGLGCVHRSGTYEVHVEYCSCKGDLCNGAINPGEISISLLLLPLLMLFAKFNNVL